MTVPDGPARAKGRPSRTERAIAKMKELVASGEFSPGARLPTERELMQRFDVSRGSLREAVRAMALMGVLETRAGDGTYVTSLEPRLLLTAVGFASDLARADSLLEIHRVRRVLEPEATRLATPRLSEPDLARLENCLRRMESADAVEALIEADMAFHDVILDACGNPTLASLLRNLASETLIARTWHAAVMRGAVEATLASHRRIFDSIAARDAHLAAAADIVHLAAAEQSLQRLRAERNGRL